MNLTRDVPLSVLIIISFSQSVIGTLLSQTATSQDSESQATSSPNPKYGDDTPESTIRSFYTALAMADRDTIEYILTTPKELQDWVDAQLVITYAFHRFNETTKLHFGDEGKSLYLPSPALLALNQLKTIKPKEHGDKADWTTNPRLSTKLLRKDGHWKIDIVKSFEKPEHIPQLSRELKRTAAYIDAIAEEMENGHYDTIAKVRTEMKRRRDIISPANE